LISPAALNNPLTTPLSSLRSSPVQEFFKTADIDLSTNSTGIGIAGIPGGVPAVSIDDASNLFGESEFATAVNDRLTHKNNLLSLLIFVLLLVRLIWVKILAKVFRAYRGFFTMFPCLERCFSDNVELEGNPPFIEAISTEMMDIQCHLRLVSEAVITKYHTELERRRKLGYKYTEPERSINILESYNFEANQEYIKAFASDSHSIMEYNHKQRDSTMTGKAPSMESINIAGSNQPAGKGTELVTKEGSKYQKCATLGLGEN
jgi:hypothetical protein